MGRPLIPSAFDRRLLLLANLIIKINADGETGPLVAMLASKGINLVTDAATGVTASGHNVSFKALRKTSQNLRQQGKAAMKIIIKDTTGSFQNLKTLFEPNYKAVGDWGATITDSGKFTYPTTTTGWMDLFTLLKAKNDSYVTPAVSPLLSYLVANAVSLSNDATNGAAALVKQTSQEADTLASEKARQDRDTTFAPVMLHIRAIIKFLMKLYPNNVKALGDYGVTVVLTPKVEKTRKKVVKASTSVLNIRVGIGSTIVNTGTIPLPIYKGATISGTPFMLAVGATYKIAKGFGRVSTHNPVTDTSGNLSLIPKKLSV